ncbi:MAG: GHKL domain-containing protein [Candidatus Coproplasma sp.]
MDIGEKLVMLYRNRIFSVAGIIDSACFIVALLVLFYDRKGLNWKNALVLVAHAVGIYAVFVAANTLCFLLFDETNILLAYLPKLIVIVLYVVFFNRYKWQARVILGTLLYAFNHVFVELGASLQGVCNANADVTLPPTFRSYLLPLTVGVAALLRYFNVNKYRVIPIRSVLESVCYGVVGVSLSILRSLVMPYLMVFERTEYYLYGLYPQIYIFVTLWCVFALLLACYFFMVRDLRSHEENMELSKQTMHEEISGTLASINASNLEQLRKIRHEIKNRYAVMRVMLNKKDYDGLDAYFNEIESETFALLSQVDTGNSAFDMVFNLELSKAAANNIQVMHKLMIPPTLPLSEVDLSGLVTNLMDNAIEACEKVEEGQRKIDVSAQLVHSYFIFSISNTVAKDRAEAALSLETDKPNKELHGYGSKIVDSLIKKYNGQILRRVENDRFVVDVMLELEGDL